MRLFLLPISTKRVLIYCERTLPGKPIAITGSTSTSTSTTTTAATGNVVTTADISPSGIPSDSHLSESRTTIDKAVDKAATIWASWEQADKGWRKAAAHYGGLLVNRIPFEEWGLKSIPPLPTRTARSRARAQVAIAKGRATMEDEDTASLSKGSKEQRGSNGRIPQSIALQKGVVEAVTAAATSNTNTNADSKAVSSTQTHPHLITGGIKLEDQTVEVLYPPAFMSDLDADPILALNHLAADRQNLHRKRMWWSFVGMPLVSPFALIPIVPNFPFFYLAFRAWSHWRALNGSRHLEYLLQEQKIKLVPSPILDSLYARAFLNTKERSTPLTFPSSEDPIVIPADGDLTVSSLPTTPEIEKVTKALKEELNTSKAEVQPSATSPSSSSSSSSFDGKSVAASTTTVTTGKNGEAQKTSPKELLLLQKWNGIMIAQHYAHPAMGLEIERAVEQVSRALGIAVKEKK